MQRVPKELATAYIQNEVTKKTKAGRHGNAIGLSAIIMFSKKNQIPAAILLKGLSKHDW